MVKEHPKCSYITVMETQMKEVDKKLEKIMTKLEQIIEENGLAHTRYALLKQDVDNIGDNFRTHKKENDDNITNLWNKLSNLENKTVYISGIIAAVVTFVGWFISYIK